MIGPVIIVVALLYLMLSIVVVRWAIRYARNGRGSVKWWGWGAALVMYLIPFWDWIPTIATHQYHCANESGFWIYKSIDQWKTENPDVVVFRLPAKGSPTLRQGDVNNYTDTYFLSQRINWVIKHRGPLFINVWRWEQEIIDTKTSQPLARYVDFSSGSGRIGGEPSFKFWLQSDSCVHGLKNRDAMSAFRLNFEGIEK